MLILVGEKLWYPLGISKCWRRTEIQILTTTTGVLAGTLSLTTVIQMQKVSKELRTSLERFVMAVSNILKIFCRERKKNELLQQQLQKKKHSIQQNQARTHEMHKLQECCVQLKRRVGEQATLIQKCNFWC